LERKNFLFIFNVIGIDTNIEMNGGGKTKSQKKTFERNTLGMHMIV